jgi:phosphohistidine phosphatase SixA
MSNRSKGHRAFMWVCSVWAALLAPTSFAMADDVLWEALHAGGKVVLVRHASIERGPGQPDPRVRDPSCQTEAKLSAQGRQDAAEFGRRFRAHQVEVSQVLYSPYCRTTETATIGFEQATPGGFLALIEDMPPAEAAARSQQLQQVIGAHEGPGNLVLITHRPNVAAVSFERLGYLDALVLAPDGAGDYEELGVIRFANSD